MFAVMLLPQLVGYICTATSNADCAGTVIYTYTYTDCANLASTWTYTYTLLHSTPPAEVGGPALTASTVQCWSNAIAPSPPVFNDVCGNVVTPTGPAISGTATSNADCAGTVSTLTLIPIAPTWLLHGLILIPYCILLLLQKLVALH